jgi:hexosaminidase
MIITIPNYGIIPEGKQGAGHKAWLFIDEIIIE